MLAEHVTADDWGRLFRFRALRHRIDVLRHQVNIPRAGLLVRRQRYLAGEAAAAGFQSPGAQVQAGKLSPDAGGDAPKEEFPDLLHPNDAGYTRWASALRPIFATLGLLETTPDTFTVETGFDSLFDGRTLTGWGYRPTTEADKESARKWQASDPKGAAAWPIVTEPTVV